MLKANIWIILQGDACCNLLSLWKFLVSLPIPIQLVNALHLNQYGTLKQNLVCVAPMVNNGILYKWSAQKSMLIANRIKFIIMHKGNVFLKVKNNQLEHQQYVPLKNHIITVLTKPALYAPQTSLIIIQKNTNAKNLLFQKKIQDKHPQISKGLLEYVLQDMYIADQSTCAFLMRNLSHKLNLFLMIFHNKNKNNLTTRTRRWVILLALQKNPFGIEILWVV